MYKISALDICLEVGFNADEKYGKALDVRYETRGLVVGKDHLVLYFVGIPKEEAIITHVLSTKSNYLNLFK